MRILHISNKPAFPVIDGGCVAIKSVLKSLISKKSFNVFHLTLSSYKHPFDESAYPSTWKDRMKLDHFFINTKTDLLGALIHLIKNKSYNVSRFYDKQLVKQLHQLLEKELFDTVLLESIYLLPYLDVFRQYNLKVVVRTHNVEHEIWSELSRASKSRIKKSYFNKLSRQLKEYELSVLKKVDGVITISQDDLNYFKEAGITVGGIVLPTSIKTDFALPDYQLKDFYFLGAMDWLPNKEGIDWLVKSVLNDQRVSEKVYIAGKGMKKNKISSPYVESIGEVDNARSFINQHGICLIPLLSGSGLRIKLLENMALGKPIVTTSVGAKGVDVVNKKHVLIADTPADFFAAMEELSMDISLRKKLGKAAQQFVFDNFDEQKITQKLVDFIKKI